MKKIISLVFLLIFIPTICLPLYAADTTKKTEIVIGSPDIDRSNEEVDKIINDIKSSNKNATKITLYQVEFASADEKLVEEIISTENAGALGAIIKKETITKITTEKLVTEKDKILKDEILLTVTQGNTEVLDKSIKNTLKPIYAGELLAETHLNLGNTISVTYHKNRSYKGPSDGSENQTREYHIRVYTEEGNYLQTKTTSFSRGKDELVTVKGVYARPTKVVLYSIDY